MFLNSNNKTEPYSFYQAHVGLVQAQFNIEYVTTRRILESLLCVASISINKKNFDTFNINKLFIKDFELYHFKKQRTFYGYLKTFFDQIDSYSFIPCDESPLYKEHNGKEIKLFDTEACKYNRKEKAFEFRFTSTAFEYLSHRASNYRTCYLKDTADVDSMVEFYITRRLLSHVEKIILCKKLDENKATPFISHGNKEKLQGSIKLKTFENLKINVPLYVLKKFPTTAKKSKFVLETMPTILEKISSKSPFIFSMQLNYKTVAKIVDGKKVPKKLKKKTTYVYDHVLKQITIHINQHYKIRQDYLSRQDHFKNVGEKIINCFLKIRFNDFLQTEFAFIEENNKHVVIGFADKYKNTQNKTVKFFTYEQKFIEKKIDLQINSARIAKGKLNELYFKFGQQAQQTFFNFLHQEKDIDLFFKNNKVLKMIARKQDARSQINSFQLVTPVIDNSSKTNQKLKHNLEKVQNQFEEQCLKYNAYNFSETELLLLKNKMTSVHSLLHNKYG